MQFLSLFLWLGLARAASGIEWQTASAPWDRGLGSHRITVKSESDAPAVLARLEWRRRDREPERKAVLVYDLKTGKQVPNAFGRSISAEAGEVVFQPVSGAGEYAVYFLPVKIEGGAFPVSRYLPPLPVADAAWAASATGALPEAKPVRWEAISEMDRWNEMEVIATDAEVKALERAWKDGAALLIPGKGRSIRMLDRLPQKLVIDATMDAKRLHGAFSARPGECVAFQIAVWSGLRDLKNVRVSFSDIRDSASPEIDPKSIVCLNAVHTDWNGRASQQPVNISKGRVQPLWFTITMPEKPAGEVIVASLSSEDGWQSESVFLKFESTGEPIADHGDSNPQSLSRLRWLNSTTAVDDEPVKGYSPLEFAEAERAIRCLGRRVVIGADGLPERITSFFNPAVTGISAGPGLEMLAAPMRFVVKGKTGGEHLFKPGPIKMTTENGKVRWEVENRLESGADGAAAGLPATLRVSGWMEFDGSVHLSAVLGKAGAIDVSDVSLVIARTPESSRYVLGLQQETGLCPDAFDWRWDTANRNQDSVWLGAVNGGLRMQLKGRDYVRPSVNIHYKRRPLLDPDSWSGGGQGGMRWKDHTLTCFSGPRQIANGEPLHFNFDLLVTPFHPLNTKAQWADRYFHTGGVPKDTAKYLDGAKAQGATVVNIHQGNALNPYINYPFLTADRLRDFSKAAHDRGMRAKFYYTVRELSNWCPELFAFRSLGDEILMSGKGGGHPWGEEHLGGDYWQAWFEPATQDVSFLTQPMSRFHNYYIEGLRWLCGNAGCDGIYLDDIAYDRAIMLRARKVLDRYSPRGGLIDLHSWNEFHDGGAWAHCPNIFMDSFPFVDRLWFGEGHHYSGPPPEHFLVELSGIPFGLMGEMLEGGGNPWLGLVHGCTGRLGWQGDPRAVWKLWDDFGVQDSEFIGWWAGDASPVRTADPSVKATVWKKKDTVLLAVANFAKEPKSPALQINWQALGLDPAKVKFYAPAIPGLRQREALFTTADKLPLLHPVGGAAFIIDGQERILGTAQPQAALGEVILEAPFASGLDKSWRPVISPAAPQGGKLDAGYVLEVPANVHAFLEHDLPDAAAAVSARVWQDGRDQGQQWGPGLALVWPDGNTLRASIRQDGRLSVAVRSGDNLDASITARAPIEFTIRWDKAQVQVIAGGPAMNDLPEVIAVFPRSQFPGRPSLLRAGKMPNDASARDFGEPGPVGFNRIEWIRVHR